MFRILGVFFLLIVGLFASFGVDFVQNKGQFDSAVAYHTNRGGIELFVLKNGHLNYKISKLQNQNLRLVNLQESLLNASFPSFSAQDKQDVFVSYFKAKNSQDAQSFKTLHFGEIYKGISLSLVAKTKGVEKIFSVKPNANPADIKLQLNGATNLRLENDELVATTKLGDVRFSKPLAWTGAKNKNFVDVKYKINKNSYSFVVADYDKSKTLTIDPMLASNFLGQSTQITDLKVVDDLVYVAGFTYQDLGVANPAKPYNAQKDGFVAILNKDLNETKRISYIGGNDDDQINAFSLDEQGNLIVVGQTKSSNFPTTSPSAAFKGATDAFIAKLSPQLALVSSKLFGGDKEDVFSSVDINGAKIVVGGYTTSSIALQNGHKTSQSGNYDGIVLYYDLALETTAQTYIGEEKADYIDKIKFKNNQIIAVGRTEKLTPSTGFSAHAGKTDLLIAQISPDLMDLNLSLYGGAEDEYAFGMDVNASLNGVVIAATTKSANLPNASGTFGGEKDGLLVLVKLPLLSTSISSVYIGGDKQDELTDVISDKESNKIFVLGYTKSNNLQASANAYMQNYSGDDDVFVARFGDLNKEKLSYLGHDAQDLSSKLAVDKTGVYLSGLTRSGANFPFSFITNTSANAHLVSAFVVKLDEDLSQDFANLVSSPSILDFENITLANSQTKQLNLTNSGTKALDIVSIKIEPQNSDFKITQNTCQSSLLARKTCYVDIEFKAKKLNENEAKLVVTHTTNVEQEIDLKAIVNTDPLQKISIKPSVLDFDMVGVNTSKIIDLEIYNLGKQNLVISEFISADKNFSTQLSASSSKPCASLTPTINENDYCAISVKFVPKAVAVFDRHLKIISNDAHGNQNLNVSLKGKSSNGLIVNSSSLDFSNVAISHNKLLTLELTNKSQNSINLTSFDFSDPMFSNDASSTCTTSLASNASCNLVVKFTPTSVGVKQASLKINSSDVSNPQITVNLKAKALPNPAPVLRISPATHDFGQISINGEKEKVFTLFNDGALDLTLTSITSPSADLELDLNAGDNACVSETKTIVPTENCTFSVKFKPTTPVTHTDVKLAIASNVPEQEIRLWAKGSVSATNVLRLKKFIVNPSFGVSPLLVKFDALAEGGSGNYEYSWDFNNSQTSTLANPEMTFTDKKDYKVKLKVNDADNADYYILADANISVVGSYVPVVIEGISINPSAGAIPLSVNVDATVTGGSGSYTYLWDFGNSKTSNQKTTSTVYNTSGTHNVTLKVTDALVPSSVATSSFEVHAVNTSQFSLAFTASPLVGKAPLDVTFKGAIVNGTAPFELKWDFGDGTTQTQTTNSTNVQMTHKYDKTGSFRVLVTSKDANSKRAYSTFEINPSLEITSKQPIVDSGAKTKGDYCFIATAAFGGLFTKEVKILRNFRDKHLLTNTAGKYFVAKYYEYSPSIANIIKDSPTLRFLVRLVLTPTVYFIEYFFQTIVLFVLILGLFYIKNAQFQVIGKGLRS